MGVGGEWARGFLRGRQAEQSRQEGKGLVSSDPSGHGCPSSNGPSVDRLRTGSGSSRSCSEALRSTQLKGLPPWAPAAAALRATRGTPIKEKKTPIPDEPNWNLYVGPRPGMPSAPRVLLTC